MKMPRRFAMTVLPFALIATAPAFADDAAAPARDQVVAPCDADAQAASWKYPVRARSARNEGVVALRVLVGADGNPQDVEIAQSSGSFHLDRAAVSGARKARLCSLDGSTAANQGWADMRVVYKLERLYADL